MNKKQSIQQMEFAKLVIYLQKNEFRTISLTSTKVNSKQAKYLKTQSVEQLEEKKSRENISRYSQRQEFPAQDSNNIRNSSEN